MVQVFTISLGLCLCLYWPCELNSSTW